MVKINGSSFALQYKRTTGRPIDSTATFKTLEDATSYARNTDAEEYFPYPGQIISVEVDGGIYKLLIDTEIPDTDGRKHYKLSPINTGEESDGKYISKIEDDEAKGNITFLAGIDVKTKAVIQKIIAEYATFSKEISSEEYVQNLLGWLITSSGDIDAKSLRLRDFLEVPELRYNRVSVITGEEWNAPGGGIIESVDEENSIVYLKLEPGEIAAIEVDDICKANFNNDTGFQTTYFRITEKLDNGSFKYVLRSGYTYHPQKAMHFVCYGNFTNAERQNSSYSTQNYIRFLKGVNNWEITKDMIAMQLGDLSNLKLFGIDMTGYSAYLNRIYMTGTIKQISNDGVTEVPVPAFKGEWKAGTYWYYDEVTHNGSTWICIESTTTQEPSDSSTDWLKVISKGEDGASGKGVKSIVEQYYLSTSQTSLTGGSWNTTPPTWENGKYIWTRSVITYTDSTSTTTSPICSTGSTGETGIGVKSVAEQYYLSTSYSTTTGGSWQTSVPAWQDGKYIWTRVVITYTDNTYTETDPVCVTGGKGPSGNDGVGISAVDVLFYLSTSSSSLEGGSWSTTSPAWEDGKYLWTKTKVTYTNGSTWESDPACITGSQGKTGLPGAMLRPRGVWKANTEYYNNETFIDTVIYDGQNKLCKITHTSTSSFDSTKWEEFNEFVNVATNVLLAQNATIDVLGTSGIFVGNLEKTEGWMFTEGAIKHNVTGVELTSDGKISLPETGGITVGGETFIEAGKIKTKFIDVDTLEVTHLKGATGSFKRLVGVEIENEKEVEKCAIGFSASEGKMYFEGDIQHQGTYKDEDGTERSFRFLTADLWCRGEFGHYKMTKITVSANYSANFYVHVYGYGTDTSEHKYPESGRPIDCVVMEGSGNSVLRICESAMYKKITVVNNSDYPKRVIFNHSTSLTYTIEAWGAKTFITADIQTSVYPYIVNNLFVTQ